MDKSWPSNRRERMVEYVGEDGDFEEFDSTGETAAHHEEVMRRLYGSDKDRKAAVKEWKIDNGEAVDSSEVEDESESQFEEQGDTPATGPNAFFDNATVYEDPEATDSTDETADEATERLEAAQWETLMRVKALLTLPDEPQSTVQAQPKPSKRPKKRGPVAVGDCTGEVIKILSSELNGKCVNYALQWSNGGRNEKAFTSGKIPRDLVDQFHRDNPAAPKGKGVDKPDKGVAKKKKKNQTVAAAQRQPAKASKAKTIQTSALQTAYASSVTKSRSQSVSTQNATKASPSGPARSSQSASTQSKQTSIQHATSTSTPAPIPAAATTMTQQQSPMLKNASQKTTCAAMVCESDSDDDGLWGDGDSNDGMVDDNVTVPAVERLRIPTPSIIGYGDDHELAFTDGEPVPTSWPSPSAQDDASFDEEFHNEWNSTFGEGWPVASTEHNLSAQDDAEVDEDSATLSEHQIRQQPETQPRERATMTRAEKTTDTKAKKVARKEKKRSIAAAARKPAVLTMLQTTINKICLFQNDAARCKPTEGFPLPDDEAIDLLGEVVLKPEPDLQEVISALGLNDERGRLLCNDLREVQNGIGCSLRLEGDLSDEHKLKVIIRAHFMLTYCSWGTHYFSQPMCGSNIGKRTHWGQHPTDILLAFCKLVYRASKKYEARRKGINKRDHQDGTPGPGSPAPPPPVSAPIAPIAPLAPVSGPAAFGQIAPAYITHSPESHDALAYGHPIIPSFSQHTAAVYSPTTYNPDMEAAPAHAPTSVSGPGIGQTMSSHIQHWPFHDDEIIVIDDEEEVMASPQANPQSVTQEMPTVAQQYGASPNDFISIGQNGPAVVALPRDYPALGRALIDQYTAESLDPASVIPDNLHGPSPPAAAKRSYETIELDSDDGDVTALNSAKRVRLTTPVDINNPGGADGDCVFDDVDESASQSYPGPPEQRSIAAPAVQGNQELVELSYHKTNAMQSTRADFNDQVYEIPESQNQATSNSQSDNDGPSVSGALPVPNSAASADKSRMPQLLAMFLNERMNLDKAQKREREKFLLKVQPQQAEIERLRMISKQENLAPAHQCVYQLQAEKMQLDVSYSKNEFLKAQIGACKKQLENQQETHKQLVRMPTSQVNTSKVAQFLEKTYHANKMAHTGNV